MERLFGKSSSRHDGLLCLPCSFETLEEKMNEHYDGFAVDLADELESIYHWEDPNSWYDDWFEEDEFEEDEQLEN